MINLTDRLRDATLDPETGEDLDPGCFASAPVEDVREAADEITRLKAEVASIRDILAATDLVSLPNDYPTAQMAIDRMERIKELTLDGLTQIGLRERSETEIERLREALRLAENAVADIDAPLTRDRIATLKGNINT